MPELPEVETVVRDLLPLVLGRMIQRVERSGKRLRRPWPRGGERRLTGRRVMALERRGKWIMTALDDGSVMIVHLGMTGRLTVESADAPRLAHTHVIWHLDDGREWRFCDERRFGSVTLAANRAEAEEAVMGRLGPEPWEITTDEWWAALRGTRRSVKAVLMDQSVIAGVGNIYADESCFAAGIGPRRSSRRIRRSEAERLLHAMREVLSRAVAQRGSTIRNYVGGSGLRGGYQEEFAVYGRAGQPCLACGEPIRRVRHAGRSTHYCPRCQH